MEIIQLLNLAADQHAMIDTIEDYWDVVHIMMNGKIAATRHNVPGNSDDKDLETLFFEITEGKA